MSYSRTTWSNGDTITAAKLNNIETGILGNESGISTISTTVASNSASIATNTLNETSLVKKVSEMVYNVDINSDDGLIPFRATNGDSITIATQDSSTFATYDQLRFYDIDRNYITNWGTHPAYGYSRTFTYDQSTEAYFIGITSVTSTVYDYNVNNNSSSHYLEAKALNEQISILEDATESTSEKIKVINRFDTSTITSGYYLATSDGTLVSYSGFFASDYIDIHDLTNVSCSYTHIVCFYKTDKTFVSGQGFNTISADGTIARPTDAYYMRFSTYTDYLNNAQIGASVSRSDYVAYGKFTMPNLIKDEQEIVVDVNGGGDYTSFTQAVYENVDSGVKIIVMPGSYDIVQEYEDLFGTDAVDAMADSDSSTFNGFQFGIIIRNRTVEFAAGSHILCDWTYQSDGTTQRTVDGTHRFSALRVDYNCKIIGLDLEVTRTFYAIHDDYGLASDPYTVEYERCKVTGTNIVNANCIGGGCKMYSTHILKDCYFDNNYSSEIVVRYHNTNATGAEPTIYVSNCYFNTYFTPRWYGSQTSMMRVYVNNCQAKSIHKLQESSSYNVDNVELVKWCNTETDPVS